MGFDGHTDVFRFIEHIGNCVEIFDVLAGAVAVDENSFEFGNGSTDFGV